MKPEDKVPTLEQCQRLKELGVVLNTEKFWRYHIDGRQSLSLSGRPSDDPSVKVIPAPDVAELGDFLPPCIEGEEVDFYGDEDRYYFLSFKLEAGWVAEFGDMQTFENYSTEAQARCAALIWLVENDYIKP